MTQDVTNRIKELELLKARREIMTEPFINSPFTYEEDFYTREETAELLDACAKLDFVRQKTPWKLEKRYAVIAFGESGGRPYNTEVRPLSEAPDAIKTLLAKLSAYSGKKVNYASVVRYVDGTDYMGWHQHREDRGHDATIWIVSTGAERLFGLRDIETKQVFKFIVKPGSLITLSSEANDTHEHAVLRVPGCKSVRYAVNCKALSPHRPRIWDCHAGKKYPADAVYVGREVKDRRGKLIRAASPFGNPYLSPEEFRAYAEEKMKDAAFAGQVMALRGKDLLCWCRPHEADRCHARIWLELANAPKGETSVAAGAKATTTESQSITAAPNRPAVARKRKAPARKAYEHNPSFLTKEEADELYDMILKQEWTIKDDGRAQLTYGVSYDRGGPIPTEIPVIPDFLRRLADRVSEKTQYPVNFVQVHRFEPEHPVFPHYDPRGMCVPMITVGQERTFQVGDDGNSKSPSGKQQNRKVEDHSPESRILMRHGDLLVFTGNKVMHSMYPASKDEQFSPNGYDYRISILFRYTTEAMRKFGVGVCNRYGQEKQYRDAVRAFRARQATMAEEEKQKQISASDATEATTREQVISKAVCIDCVTGLDSLPEKSVACVVTSPPYNIGIKYGTHDDNRDDYLEWMQSVFVRIKRVLVDDGQFFLQVGGIPTNPLIYERVMRQALAAGFVVQNAIVWAKSIAIDDVTYGHFKPVNSNRFENNAHEHIFHLTKSGMVPLKGSSPFLEDTLWFIPYVTANKIKERPKHPAVFPIALPERCIQSSGVPKGSLVIDPFVGSGTTLIACEKLGMTGLGFDIDNAYVEYANRRLERLSRERRVEVGGERTEEAAEDGSQPDVCFSLEA